MAIVFGVAGGTASGKTTVANKILQMIGTENVAYLPHDAYYRHNPHLTYSARTQVNYDHPESLESELLIAHIDALLRGETVERPNYDFVNHLRKNTVTLVQPSQVILVDGILIFNDVRLRERMDIKVYVDTDADVRFIRRLHRDVEDRGRSMDSVIGQYLNTVRPMHLEFVEPSKRYADIIIPRGGMNQVAVDMVVSRLRSLLVNNDDATND